jgi:ABC-type transport system substrate-binding protein
VSYRCLLHRNVVFHDGEPWNAAAAKANFDQVFAGPLKEGYHGWYDLPKYIKSWEVCTCVLVT